MKRRIAADDLLPLAAYEAERRARRAAIAALKRDRRVEIGPYGTFYFENYATMFHQVMEMLAIEKGGALQVQDELDAYNPLIPQGDDLRCTFMFEIEDPERRARELARLGGVEDCFSLAIEGKRCKAEPIGEEARTREDGKTSSVHFLRFPLDAAARAAFKRPGAEAVLAIDHPNYGHMARIPEPVRASLAADLD